MGKKLICLFLGGMLFFPVFLSAECFNQSEWGKILEANISTEGLVNYDGVRINKGGNLFQYLTYVEMADLGGCSQTGKLAFWINAYNANVFRQVLSLGEDNTIGPKSPIYSKNEYVANKKISLRKIQKYVLGSKQKSQNENTSEELKKKDPRAFFAVAPGTLDGPALLDVPYSEDGLSVQLDKAVDSYVNNPNHIRIENDSLVLSQYLQFIQPEFESLGGLAVFLANKIKEGQHPDAQAVKEKLATDFPDKVLFVADDTLNHIRNKK